MPEQTGMDRTSTRRDFVKATSVVAAAAAATLVVPQGVFAATDNKIKIGLVGVGGRGSGAAANACRADENVVLYAVGDMFPDQIEEHIKPLADRTGQPD